MTEGSISQKIIFFAIPLFLGNLFQQLYNTADSLIVGNFLGSNALAAVSSSGNLIFLMVGFINGIAMGAGVVIARYYGAKKRDCLQKAIHTTVAFGFVAGAVLTVLGMFLAPKILVLMGTPGDVLPESIVYFRTYFAGSMGVVMYNIFVGVLQSVGDGRHPLIYLIISSVSMSFWIFSLSQVLAWESDQQHLQPQFHSLSVHCSVWFICCVWKKNTVWNCERFVLTVLC